MSTTTTSKKKKRRRRSVPRKNLSVRPTLEQHEALQLRAERFGYKSLSRYLIERGLREGEMIVSVDRELIERLLFEVRRAGQNLNLIARRVCSPSGGSVASDAVERAAREVTRVTGEVGEALNR